ncbi:serine hydrolase [Streptomyces sp. 796.1]|uniref:serine hydrolase n=1 Tax=Streptomyces sp. 796.1 TaxID=3163029 RepID=UPI0039C99052
MSQYRISRTSDGLDAPQRARRAGRPTKSALGALAVALTAGVLVPPITGATAASAAPQTVCSSAQKGLAAKLTKDIGAALKGRRTTVAIALSDPSTKTTCTLRADQKYDSASVVKVTVLSTLLWDAQKSKRKLTQRETKLATAMITKSDNDSTTALWKQLGVTRVKNFLRAAGMTKTVPGSDGYWGLTQITARDQQRLLNLIMTKNSVLTDASRSYVKDLMNKVVSSQRWGTPAGAPSGTKIHVKNGWLPRATHGWRVHSIGAFSKDRKDYTITVLSHDNRTMQDGVNAIQAVARAVHKDLRPSTKAARYAPTLTPQETLPHVPR